MSIIINYIKNIFTTPTNKIIEKYLTDTNPELEGLNQIFDTHINHIKNIIKKQREELHYMSITGMNENQYQDLIEQHKRELNAYIQIYQELYQIINQN